MSNKCEWCFLGKKVSSVVYCQGGGGGGGGGGGKAIRSSGFSSVLTERSSSSSSSSLVGDQGHSSSVMDTARSLVVSSPNGKGQPEIAMKDFEPYNDGLTSSSLIDMRDGIGIVKFLRGRGFFITGATGFLAKDSTDRTDVGKIYVLIKAKSKEAAMARLKSEIINAELFKSLQQTYGKSYQAFMLSKLVPVVGNICESNLGLEEDLTNLIANDVDVIVNSAANTTFDERYDVAVDINTRGACHLMNFAKKCQNLKLFLQVSTAYVNGQRQGRIMEKTFCIGDCIAKENFISESTSGSLLPILDVEYEMKLALNSKDGLQESEVAQEMKRLGLERARRYGWQDTYVFTKAMGEMMIDSMRGEIPVVIIRPSVIESTCREPFPGWMEGN
ncbi:Male sterility protein, putative, partial [Ricinus communis]